MVDEIEQRERDKYNLMWTYDSYRERSPGMRFLDDALQYLRPGPGATVVDLGCGTGRVSEALARAGHNVTAVDISQDACREFAGRFVTACLWNLPDDLGDFQYGFCADVMEHIPTERVGQTLASIADHVDTVYFQIANFECHEGDKIGEHLHLTVKPLDWWVGALSHDWVVKMSYAAPKHHVFVCKSRAF